MLPRSLYFFRVRSLHDKAEIATSNRFTEDMANSMLTSFNSLMPSLFFSIFQSS